MLQMRGNDGRNSSTLEGILQRQGTVKHTTKRIEIGAVVDRLAVELLGREEVNRTRQRTQVVECLLGGRRQDFCESEIQQFHPQVASFCPSDHDVRGLDVPVHHAQRVRRPKRVEALAGKLVKHPSIHRSIQFVQGRAVDEFHNNEHIFV